MSEPSTRSDSQAVKLKLAATAVTATVLIGLITALTLQTMSAARAVEVQARQTHLRIRSYWALQEVTRRYHELTYKVPAPDGAGPVADITPVRNEFGQALQHVLELPQSDAQEQQFAEQLKVQSVEVLAYFDQAPRMAQRMDDLWKTAGSQAALAEMTALAAPYDRFHRTIDAARSRNGQLFADATQRAAASNGWMRAIALFVLAFGFLMAAALYLVLIKRLALQKANAVLAADDERRRTFLVDASHELRIPMTIIRGEAQVALRQESGARHETIEALERILGQTRAASRMLDDLFLIARAEAGGLRMNLQRIDAGAIASDTASDFATLACETGATVSCHTETDLAVIADADRLRQMIAALIDNALRHTRPGVAIEVEGRAEAGNALVAVSDNGPGIEPALATQLFQRFRRGRSRSEGSGLGLTVVRALAEAHHGSVNIESAPGGGARFCLRLPLAPATSRVAVGAGGMRELVTAG